jgi:hypothetical protein
MCITILGVTICISVAQPKEPAYIRYTPEQLLEQSRQKALLYELTNWR